MFVTIDGSGGSSTVQANGALLTFNILRAIKAVANSAAGSTPSATVIITANTLFGNVVVGYNSNTVLSVLGANTPTGSAFVSGMGINTPVGSFTGNTIGTANSITVSGTFANVSIPGQITFTNTTGGFTVTSTSGIANGVGIYISNTVGATGAPTGYSSPTTYTVFNSTNSSSGQLVSNTGAVLSTVAGTSANLLLNIGVFNVTANSGPVVNGMVLFPVTTPANSVYITGTTATANQYTLNTSAITGTPTSAYCITLNTPLSPFLTNTNIVAYQYGSNNLITGIIANTEGGGWNLDINNTVQDYFQISNTTVNGLVLDLYNTVTNKIAYPYHKVAIIGSAANTSAGSSGNSTIVTSNHFLVYHGAANGQNWSNALSGFAPATVGTTAPSGPSAMVNQRTNYAVAGYNWTSTDYIFTLACNSYYMHIISNNFLVSMGLRTTQPWEDNYSDNPPVYNFSIDTRSYGTSVFYPSSMFAYMRSISNTATFNAPARYQTNYAGIVPAGITNPVTSQAMTTAATAPQTFDIAYVRAQAPMGGVFQVDSHYLTTVSPVGYGPVYDTTTGTFVPPAYPITIQLARAGQYNTGGNARGIYKSLSGAWNAVSALGISNFYVANAAYTVDGELYTPVLNGSNAATTSTDLFLVRRA